MLYWYFHFFPLLFNMRIVMSYCLPKVTCNDKTLRLLGHYWCNNKSEKYIFQQIGVCRTQSIQGKKIYLLLENTKNNFFGGGEF